jgi:hypothetical protein
MRSVMTRNMISVAVVAAMLIPGVALGQKVNVDSDPNAGFASYRTYKWTKGTPSPNPDAEQRLHEAVDQQLAAKGLTEVSDNPDVVVATHVVTEQQQLMVNGFGDGGNFGGVGTAQAEAYEQGTLAVDLYDGRTRQLVWRGTASDTLTATPEKNTSKINKSLSRMFRRYPPQSK